MNLEEKTANNSGNNSGPRQGGGTPNSGNMSTPLRQDVRRVQVNSLSNKGKQQNYQAATSRVQKQVERNRGTLQSQGTTQVQSREQDFEDTYYDDYQDSDRGQEIEDNKLTVVKLETTTTWEIKTTVTSNTVSPKIKGTKICKYNFKK